MPTSLRQEDEMNDKVVNTIVTSLLVAAIVGSIQAYRELGALASVTLTITDRQEHIERRVERLEDRCYE